MPRKKKAETASLSPKVPLNRKRSLTPKSTVKSSSKPKKLAPIPTPKIKKPKKLIGRVKSSPLSKKPTGSIRQKSNRKGETQMVAFIRDPECIFTYWEVTPESIEAVKKQLMEEYKESLMVLRVFKTGSNGETELIQEIQVKPGEMNRYVELKPSDGLYFVEIAQKTTSGRIVVYARSNNILTGIAPETPTASPTSPDSSMETPESLLEYFADVNGTEVSDSHPVLSSAEAYLKELKKKKLDRYSASRMN